MLSRSRASSRVRGFHKPSQSAEVLPREAMVRFKWGEQPYRGGIGRIVNRNLPIGWGMVQFMPITCSWQ